MSAPALPIDREQARMLVLAVGCTEAAKQLGIPLNTVLSWSARGRWLAKPETPPSVLRRVAIGAIKPADALANTLNERHEHTKLGLSLYTARAARVASRLPGEELLARASEVSAVASVAGKVWPEQSQASTQVLINIALLGRDLPDVRMVEQSSDAVEQA